MTTDQWIVLATTVAAMAAFVSERIAAEIVALMVLCVLAVSGVLNGHEALSGFSSPALIAVGAMLVLSSALESGGALRFVARLFARHANSRTAFRAALMATSAALSAFINNTAVVAVLMPTVIRIARERGWSTQRFLIPLSYSAQFGGVCTLIGTSTNLLVQALAVDAGLQGFSLFEFTALGLVTTLAGTIYLLVASPLLLPERSDASPEALFELDDFVTELVVSGEALAGRPLAALELPARFGFRPIDVIRDGSALDPLAHAALRLGDVIRVSGPVSRLTALDRNSGLRLLEEHGTGWAPRDAKKRRLLHVLVPAQSGAIDHSPAELGFSDRYDAVLIAVRRHGNPITRRLSDVHFQVGDVVLFIGSPEGAAALQASKDFVVLREDLHAPDEARGVGLPVAVTLAVVSAVAMGWLPIYLAATIGCLVLVLARRMTSTEAIEAIQWRVLFLIAGMLPLGIAIEKTGLAGKAVAAYLEVGGSASPETALCLLYLATAIATEFLSNNAAAVLLVPVAFSLSQHFGVDPKPFLVAIAFAASSSFSTPMGYQTNTMVYDAGNYRFTDFLRIGLPLNLLFWLVASLCIPWFFPFQAHVR